ncbi:MAG: efflux RND transporter periplasmic adaptor subunit [Saprospiraceae bacterium]
MPLFKEERLFTLFLFCFVFLSCEQTVPPDEDAILESSVVEQQAVAIQTTTTRLESFPLKINTNGRIQARQQIELKIDAAGRVDQFNLKEGQSIKKGALVLALDPTEKELRLKQYQFDVDNAMINKADQLISNGGEAYLDSSVSERRLELINKISGYDKAVQALEIAKFELGKMKLFAPFSGIVADVEVQKEAYIPSGQTICKLINPASFEAKFTLIEQEAVHLSLGQSVEVQPLSNTNKTYRAKITAINPIVDEQGLVTIYARIQGASRATLFEGMNVLVSVQKRIPKQLVVPREAVVLRSGRSVVFTHDTKDNLAKWNYVTVSHENDQAVVITEGLQVDDRVIVVGNLNLDHDARVQLQEN